MEELLTIPLFPLALVAYPGKQLNLHIFEPRYRQLINDCQEGGLQFGIPTVQKNAPLNFGTLMSLEEISHIYPDGKMDVKTRGVKPIKILDYYSILGDKLYPGGEVAVVPYHDQAGRKELAEDVLSLIQKLYELIKVDHAPPSWSPDFRVFSVADKLGLSINAELQLLMTKDENERLYQVKQHLLKIIPAVTNIENMKERIESNGHFKNFMPPDLPPRKKL